jgi:hypothetical protein
MKLDFLALCLAVLAIGGAMTLALAAPAVLAPSSAAASPRTEPVLRPADDRKRLFDERRIRFASR